MLINEKLKKNIHCNFYYTLYCYIMTICGDEISEIKSFKCLKSFAMIELEKNEGRTLDHIKKSAFPTYEWKGYSGGRFLPYELILLA